MVPDIVFVIVGVILVLCAAIPLIGRALNRWGRR